MQSFSACWGKCIEYHFSLVVGNTFVRWCLWVASTRKNIRVKFSYERDGRSVPELPNLVMREIGGRKPLEFSNSNIRRICIMVMTCLYRDTYLHHKHKTCIGPNIVMRGKGVMLLKY